MHYSEINSERQFKDATGHSKNSFKKLLADYESTFLEEYEQTYEEYAGKNAFTLQNSKRLGNVCFLYCTN